MQQKKMETLHPVMNFPDDIRQIEQLNGDVLINLRDFIARGGWAIGGYLDRRKNVYIAPQYQNRRYIHMGIDIWAPVGEPVFAPAAGTVIYKANNDEVGNYGPTIIVKHQVHEEILFALYGHLSLESLQNNDIGRKLSAGDTIGFIGNEAENGNWPPHLHVQLSRKDPGKADMPGVVSDDELEDAVKRYPNPSAFLAGFPEKLTF